MPLVPALRWQGQVDLCEFEARLDYRASSRTVKSTQRKKKFVKRDFLMLLGSFL